MVDTLKTISKIISANKRNTSGILMYNPYITGLSI